ncbi:MAG: phosphoenolpyruvate--protein phosphotransferase [Acidimicrobiales bacterium]
MVGVVIVSHSATLADGVAELARGMSGDEVRLAVAGGMDAPDHPLGTDAMLVMRAIDEVWSEDGVLVLMDLGSAVLSAEMALEFLPDERRAKVLLCDAPVVEGAVAAVVAAKLGEPLDQVAEEARGGLLPKTAHLGPAADPAVVEPAPVPSVPLDGSERELVVTVGNTHGLHARPAARLVQTAGRYDAEVTVENLTSGRGPVAARSLNAVATLGVQQGHEIRIRARGPDADEVVTAVDELAADNFGDPPDAGAPVPPPVAASRVERPPAVDIGPGVVVHGLAASPGIAIGPARHARLAELEIPDDPVDDREAAVDALRDAIAATRTEIGGHRDQVAGSGAGYESEIFDAHLLFLDDPALVEPAEQAIRTDGVNPAKAWTEAAAGLRAEWEALDDPYLRERAGDLTAVAEQVALHLLGVERSGVSLAGPGVLVARDLTPADTAGLDRRVVLGIATAAGGPTSHTAILARALDIPAVVGLGNALLAVDDGTELVVDGEAGTVMVDPGADVVAAASRRTAARAEHLARARERAAEPAVTRDGVTIEVAANLGSPDDAAGAVAAGADAVGLFRTEFVFLSATTSPTEDEQAAAYLAVAERLGGRPLLTRTLDAGSDKPLPFLDQPAEANPAMGLRGLRLGLARPEVLRTQLRALLRVAADHPLRIMFPMVAGLDELRAARAMVDQATAELTGEGVAVPAKLEIGIMVEVPASALAAGLLAEVADFFSIGTNDLSQYTLAADRTNEAVAGLADGLHPAVLRLVGITCEAAVGRGRWVGVCGELAGDPVATPVLLGLGVRELSMAPAAIPLVKEVVRAVDLTAAATLAAEAVTLASAADVRAMLASKPL